MTIRFQGLSKGLGCRLVLEADYALHQAIHAEQVAAVSVPPPQHLNMVLKASDLQGRVCRVEWLVAAIF